MLTRGSTSLEGDHEHSRLSNPLMAFDMIYSWEGRGPFFYRDQCVGLAAVATSPTAGWCRINYASRGQQRQRQCQANQQNPDHPGVGKLQQAELDTCFHLHYLLRYY
jgi:hypothetical protein